MRETVQPAEPPNKGPRRWIIVGNGMAGHRLLNTLRARCRLDVQITLIGEEHAAAYNRVLLSPWLAGEIARPALALEIAETRGNVSVSERLGQRVTAIDRTAREVTLETGERLAYDRLILATGSRSAMPQVPGIELGNVGTFRNLDDADWLAAQPPGRQAIVVGGGLLGLEAAEGLRRRGLEVTLLQRSERLMNRQLDRTAADWLAQTLARRGLTLMTGATLARCDGDAAGNVCAVTLADGRRLAADCVVIAAGIEAHSELGRRAGLDVARGIRVDAHLTTSDPHIHALGECCEFEGDTVGLVEPIWQQVEVLAAHLCADAPGQATTPGYVRRDCATRLKVAGVSLYAFGPAEAEDAATEVLTYADAEHGDYRRLLLRDSRLIGALLYGDTAAGPALFALAQAATPLPPCREALLFGPRDIERHLATEAQPTQEEAA